MRHPDFTTPQRNRLVQFLIEGIIDGKPVRGKMAVAAIKFGCCRKTIGRLWAAAIKQRENGQPMHLQSGKVGNTRAKRVIIDLELISSLELHKRSSIRSLAAAINCKRTTVAKWIAQGLLRAHTSAIRPNLTAPNKLLRLRFSLQALELDMILNCLKFRCMQNTIHIDEKWFNISKDNHRFYMTPGETDPHRTCKSKNFMDKVMFICAVSRPIFGLDGTVIFDGKIEIFPFTRKVPAKRASKNREKGTLETKCIESVTREVMGDFMINKILPACMRKWPSFASKRIYIQQDNAKPHLRDSDKCFRDAANKDGFSFTLVQQPANSPDVNVNDLGFFRAIQALQNEKACKTIDELVDAVVTAFEQLPPVKLDNVFLSLQSCMMEIMKVKGQNCYKIPHMGKEALRRANMLPLNLEVPHELVIQSLKYLMESGSVEGLEDIMNNLGIHSLEGQ